jgi:hypothetical protein
MDLEALPLDLAMVEIEDRIVELALLDPGRADEHAGAAIERLLRQLARRRHAGALESRLQHQILGRIPGQKELAENDKVCASERSGATHLHRLGEVPGNVAHGGIELGERDAKLVGHESRLSIGQASVSSRCRPASQ